jgi:hypothetical protein
MLRFIAKRRLAPSAMMRSQSNCSHTNREFQDGEPLLNFPLISSIVLAATKKAVITASKRIDAVAFSRRVARGEAAV